MESSVVFVVSHARLSQFDSPNGENLDGENLDGENLIWTERHLPYWLVEDSTYTAYEQCADTFTGKAVCRVGSIPQIGLQPAGCSVASAAAPRSQDAIWIGHMQ